MPLLYFLSSTSALLVPLLTESDLLSCFSASFLWASVDCKFPQPLSEYCFPLTKTTNLLSVCVSFCLSVSWGMLPGLWFELFGAHCSGRGAQLPNHPCAYLLSDWPEEESHWLPVCIIQPGCFCLSHPLNPSKNTLPARQRIESIPNFLLISVRLKISLFLVHSLKLIPATSPQ